MQEEALIRASLVFSSRILLMQIFQLIFNRPIKYNKEIGPIVRDSKKFYVSISPHFMIISFILSGFVCEVNISEVDFLVAERDVLQYFRFGFRENHIFYPCFLLLSMVDRDASIPIVNFLVIIEGEKLASRLKISTMNNKQVYS